MNQASEKPNNELMSFNLKYFLGSESECQEAFEKQISRLRSNSYTSTTLNQKIKESIKLTEIAHSVGSKYLKSAIYYERNVPLTTECKINWLKKRNDKIFQVFGTPKNEVIENTSPKNYFHTDNVYKIVNKLMDLKEKNNFPIKDSVLDTFILEQYSDASKIDMLTIRDGVLSAFESIIVQEKCWDSTLIMWTMAKIDIASLYFGIFYGVGTSIVNQEKKKILTTALKDALLVPLGVGGTTISFIEALLKYMNAYKSPESLKTTDAVLSHFEKYNSLLSQWIYFRSPSQKTFASQVNDVLTTDIKFTEAKADPLAWFENELKRKG